MPLFPHILTTILAITRFEGVVGRYNGFRHEELDATKKQLEKRLDPIILNNTITGQCSAPTRTRSIHSILYPSPEAAPVEITAQSQVVTSFVREATWCVGPPIALIPVSGLPYLNQSTEYEPLIAKTGHCETAYVPTQTTVCATTLTGIASKVTVTDCDQEVTFSSECGFTLEIPTAIATTNFSLITPAPTMKRMKTFWLAPWQSLTAGDTPSDVDIKVCTIPDDDSMECILYQETVGLSTTMLIETEVEVESISKGKKLVIRPNDDTDF
ncbi:hypothetical protein K458DRAFT_473487 [Lentithecium fluviatile CBS 122367]|uniref:Uncharacterized protein n=1 Tax=Lentithecium fluviatile CBS 122367 TaxID=1168545 RepID=A0A6G1JML3_9PLEO|nr:hypothetical protein K458DRAFT_473487 [Lentithecium fluviatile CBS 122367]